jgi:hypothetical protein
MIVDSVEAVACHLQFTSITLASGTLLRETWLLVCSTYISYPKPWMHAQSISVSRVIQSQMEETVLNCITCSLNKICSPVLLCLLLLKLSQWDISIVKPTRCTSVSNLFNFAVTIYVFRMVFPSIIRSSRLYIQQKACVKQILLSVC